MPPSCAVAAAMECNSASETASSVNDLNFHSIVKHAKVSIERLLMDHNTGSGLEYGNSVPNFGSNLLKVLRKVTNFRH